MKSFGPCFIAIYGITCAMSLKLKRVSLDIEMQYTPAQGSGGNLNSTVGGVCTQDSYVPSYLEHDFSTHVLNWTATKNSLCQHLDTRMTWIQENLEGNLQSGGSIFSRLCKKGKAPQILEPLAGVLRDPRFFCDTMDRKVLFSIDWLVVADHGELEPSSKKMFFDAGGTRFMDAMEFFTSQYEKRGITFDSIYVWEARWQGHEAYWKGTPPEVRQKWEPRVTFYDGVPISADPSHWHNPLVRMLADCLPEDFCAFKLDIDTPEIENLIVHQILDSPRVAAVMDEFFFEHHVAGLMNFDGAWSEVNGTFADSYSIFAQLRRMGVRAHSWI